MTGEQEERDELVGDDVRPEIVAFFAWLREHWPGDPRWFREEV